MERERRGNEQTIHSHALKMQRRWGRMKGTDRQTESDVYKNGEK